ncbi:MAG: glycosyltransferase family 4 protein [Bacteroidales bacterium]|nr:glycosyltransferase family 4 protein [Bacteroidales bacterium]
MSGQKKKVAFFIGSLNRGGTETLVLDSFRRSAEAPYESMLIYRNEGELSDAYRATGVPLFQIVPWGIKIGYVTRIRKLLKEEKVDILHAQTLLNALLGIFCVCFSRVKLVASFHGFRYSLTERIKTHIVMWFANASVFVSGYVRDWYIKHTVFAPRNRCHLVYNGIDFSKFDQNYVTPDFMENNYSNSSNCMNLVMVGNFVKGRSQIFLCEAVNALVEQGVGNFRLFFVGKRVASAPERYDNCVNYCRDHGILDKSVFFLGGRNDVPAILQHADAFIYSSEHDTFGIAVVEAMAAGLPVIVNDWDVMREITEDGALATLYRTGDVADCAEKIEQLFSGIEECKRLAKASSVQVRERFSIEAHIQNLNKVYEAVV